MTPEQEFKTKDQINKKIMNSSDSVKFACVINKNGRIVCTPDETDIELPPKQKEMLFMETALQTKMNRDFDAELGMLRCSVTERVNGLKCISVPISKNELIFMMVDKEYEHDSLVDYVHKMKICN